MDWRARYEHLQQYVEKLEKENNTLRHKLGLAGDVSITEAVSNKNEIPVEDNRHINQYSPPDEKIRFFRNLFRGREDVYAQRWYNFKSGKSGYAPACEDRWGNASYSKSNTSRPQYDQRTFKPLSDRAIYAHLSGTDAYDRDAIGIYPISKEDTCLFVVIDFDDGGWKDNITTVRQICAEWSIPHAVERSRSGEGAHLWIFFSEPVACADARRLGSLLLTSAMERDGKLTLSSYDRMIPCQDTLPKGGFGNLIALPLQGRARKDGNSLFIDDDFLPYADQWAFLAQIKRLSVSDVEETLRLRNKNSPLGELYDMEQNQKPWEKSKEPKITTGDFYGTQRIIKANMLFLLQSEFSPRARNQLIRLAAFRNPDFYKSQAMRLPVYNKPRIISTAEERGDYLALPRGCEPRLIKLLKEVGASYEIADKTSTGKPLAVHFQGTLHSEQVPAASALLEHETGILAATTAFGKTVIAAYLISQRKVNTLVIVHTQALLNQWKQSLEQFLAFDEDLPEQPKKRGRRRENSFIGRIGGGKNTAKGFIDIAIIKSLISSESQVKELVKDYGMVIIDECHHVSAVSFERVLKEVNARYVYGLTATPSRRDGHHPIMQLQCGPIRYQVDAKTQAKKRSFTHTVIPRFTIFAQPLDENYAWNITNIYRAMQQDEKRNSQIITDVIDAVSHHRTPIILTERYDHAQLLFEKLSEKVEQVILLSGRSSAKEKRETLARIAQVPPDEPLALVATGRYIGEGFDLPRLDTLMLAMPISWHGTLAQYAGRLHRDYGNKQEVLIYDYVDLRIPMLERMYQKRLAGYSAIGYGVRGETTPVSEGIAKENRIFNQEDYLDTFANDTRHTKRNILIISPYLHLGQVKRFLTWLPQKVKVKVITSDDSCFKKETEQKIKTAIALLEENNIQVQRLPNQCQCCAIFDKQLLWYGGINFLGYKHGDNGSMRLFSSELAEELLKMFE